MRYSDFDVRPTQPGEHPGAYWSAMFTGGWMKNAVTLEFHGEPEDRAIEALMDRLGANSVTVMPPSRAPDEPAPSVAEMLVPCPARCDNGTVTDSNGSRWGCSTCHGRGKVLA